ncbi:MAG: chemotaxis protein CheC [Nitrospiria bacterium]
MTGVQGGLSTFSEEEQGILQEVMNISFGKAVSELSEIIDAFITLGVPDVCLVPSEDFQDYLTHQIHIAHPYHGIEQSFSGKLNGHVFMVFPEGSEKRLAALLGDQSRDMVFEEAERLEKEALIEIGNILMGACVGKLVTVLNETVSFSPPRLEMAWSPSWQMPLNFIRKEGAVLSVKTQFDFLEKEINGYFFLITNEASIPWFKKALSSFLEQF